MRKFLQGALALACTAGLSLTLAACGQPAADTTDTQASDGPVEVSQRDATDPTADGRIDVTETGSLVATFHGAKYIVSDVTVDQASGDALTDRGLGLQEICVIDQPESWQDIDSIGWDRNSITYSRVAMPWGYASYRFEYINEASALEGVQEYSRTSADAYFAGLDNVQTQKVGDHDLTYVYDETTGTDLAPGIEDMEAEVPAADEAATKMVAVYAYEQRADDCAFTTTITCEVNGDAPNDVTAERLLNDTYAALNFESKDAQVDAASFIADITLTNTDGDKSLLIGRNGDDLLSYKEYSASMLEQIEGDFFVATVSYDFAPAEEPEPDLETREVDGMNVRVRVDQQEWDSTGDEPLVSQKLTAWVDVDGSPLLIVADMGEGEELADALERVITGRVVLA